MINEKINKLNFIKWVCNTKTALNRGISYRYTQSGTVSYETAGMRMPLRLTADQFFTHFEDRLEEWETDYCEAHNIKLYDQPTISIDEVSTTVSYESENGLAEFSSLDFFNWLCVYQNEVCESLSYWSVDFDQALIIRSYTETTFDVERSEIVTNGYQAEAKSFNDFIKSELGRCFIENYIECAGVEFVTEDQDEYYREDTAFAA